MKRIIGLAAIVLAGGLVGFAQESNQNTGARTRTVAPKASPTPKTGTTSSANTNTQSQRPRSGSNVSGPSTSVVAAFDKIIEGLRRANVDMVTNEYWNTPALVLFNYNGTVTKGWDQMRKNREASYPDIKDVKLEVRDRHIIMLGTGGAVVTCLWTQTQTYKGQPDAASGRMTLVFKKVGNEWKAVHLHTSPDKPDPSRIPPSEQPTP